MTDIWSSFSKKKSTLTIPGKKTNNNATSAPTASAPTATATQTTATAQPKAIKPPRVKAHKKQKVQVQQHAHVTEPSLDDFDVSTSGDANGIYISILYQHQPIYKFTLPKPFDTWQYRMDANQRLQFVKLRVNANATVFGNNAQIVQTVIMAIYNILNNIFAEAARMKSQQAHRNMI